MKQLFILFVLSLLPSLTFCQHKAEYGTIHPDAPEELADFSPLIGTCKCKSVTRNQDGTWADTLGMTWIFKYIMEGKAVQDETFKDDGIHSGSIRQYNVDSNRWYVHYYSSRSPVPQLPSWEGGKKGNDIVLFRPQKAPNGMDGFYRLTFSDISKHGYNWAGEWVNADESIVYPTWRIYCKKLEYP